MAEWVIEWTAGRMLLALDAARKEHNLTRNQEESALALAAAYWVKKHPLQLAQQPPEVREPERCGEKNKPGSHPCDAPKGHAPGSSRPARLSTHQFRPTSSVRPCRHGGRA